MEQLQNGTGAAVLYQSHTNVPETSRKTIASVQGIFAREMTLQLSAYLRANITVKCTEVEETTFGQFLEARTPRSCAAILKTSTAGANMVLDMEPPLVFAFVEMMLGGKAAAGIMPERPPTEIEKQLLGLVLTSIAAQLERAWRTVAASLSIPFGGMATNAQIARFLLQQDAVVATKFETSAGEQSGSFTILIPAQAAEALAAATETTVNEVAEAPDLSQMLMESSVGFDVWLDGVALQLRDLVQLKEGHVIKFDHPTERNLQSTLNGAQGFSGQVVSTGHRRAFLIQDEAAG